ncbi:MAG TPA: anion permease, partial [Bacillota bacterium]
MDESEADRGRAARVTGKPEDVVLRMGSSTQTSTPYRHGPAVRRGIVLAVATVAGTMVALLPPPSGLTPPAMRAMGLLLWAIICWAGDAVPDYVVALMMGLGWVVFRVVPFNVAFACFSTTSWWMMVGALGIGVAVAESGLLRRVALLALRALPPTFAGQTAGLIIAGLPFGPALPTVTGKTTLAAPFVLGISKAMGLEDRSKHSTALFMSMFTGFGLMGPLFMTGTVTNFVVLALLPASLRAHITWVSWFVTYLPTMLIIMVLSWLAIVLVCRPRTVVPLSRD